MNQTSQFYYVSSGAIAPPVGIVVNGRAITANPFNRPDWIGNSSIGSNATDADLVAMKVLRLWTEVPSKPAGQYTQTTGPVVVEADRVTRTDSWTPVPAVTKRIEYVNQIDAQIPQPSYAQSLRDPLTTRDSLLSESAANAKRLELENTSDGDLDSFDSTLVLAEPDTTEHCRLSLEIARLPEWAGQPGATVGFRATLEIQEHHEDDGGSARMIFTDIPTSEAGGVLGPFIQQAAPDEKTWILESREGHRWTDPAHAVEGYLYWDNGTRRVTPTLEAQGIGEGATRDSAVVDYTVTI